MADPRRYQFPLLSDLIRDVADKIDQPLDEPGQLTWTNPAEFALACNNSVRWIYREGSDLDINMNIKQADLSVAPNVDYVLLPEDLRAIRQTWWVSSSNPAWRGQTLRVGRWEQQGAGWDADAIFQPRRPDSDPTLDGRPALVFTQQNRPSRTLRVVYDYAIPRLAHGCVRGYGVVGLNSVIVLDEHEPFDSGALQALRLWFPRGAGAGQNEEVASYDGPTQSATMPALATALDETTIYTSRPPLHADCADVFMYDVCARLSEKLDESRTTAFKMERDRAMMVLRDSLVRLERREPLTTRDDSGTVHYDPFFSNYAGY